MSINSEQTLALKLWLWSVAVVCVALRWYVRYWLQSRITASDVFVITALVLYTMEEILGVIMYKDGFFSLPLASFSVGGLPGLETSLKDRTKMTRILSSLFFSSFFTFTTFWAIKFAFLTLYYQLVPRWFKAMRWCVHITTAFVAISYVGFLATNVFGCGDVSRNWSINPERACFSFALYPSVIYLTTIHLVTDVVIFVIPFFLLPHIQLPARQKLGLGLMFALGIVCISCAVARTATVMSAQAYTFRELLVWDSGEMTLGIMVCCGPSLKYLVLRLRGVKQRLAIKEFNGDPLTTTEGTKSGGGNTRNGTVNIGASRIGHASMGGSRWEHDDIDRETEIMGGQGKRTELGGAVVVMHEITVERQDRDDLEKGAGGWVSVSSSNSLTTLEVQSEQPTRNHTPV